MRHRQTLVPVALVVWGLLPLGLAAGQAPTANRKADQDAIRKVAEQYAEAAGKGDTGALAAIWTADGDYIDAAGTRVNAREAIQQAATDGDVALAPRQFAIRQINLRFITADVAIEDGVAEVRSEGEADAAPSRYTAIWVRQDGNWLLDSLREAPEPVAAVAASERNLADLEFLVGEWKAKLGPASYEFSNEFVDNRQVLRRRYTIREGDRVLIEGTQYVTVDPETGEIVSHASDSNGTTTDGVWSRDEDGSWTVAYEGRRSDGAVAESTHIYLPQKDQAWTWTILDSTVDGEAMPDVTLRFTRKAAP